MTPPRNPVSALAQALARVRPSAVPRAGLRDWEKDDVRLKTGQSWRVCVTRVVDPHGSVSCRLFTVPDARSEGDGPTGFGRSLFESLQRRGRLCDGATWWLERVPNERRNRR